MGNIGEEDFGVICTPKAVDPTVDASTSTGNEGTSTGVSRSNTGQENLETIPRGNNTATTRNNTLQENQGDAPRSNNTATTRDKSILGENNHGTLIDNESDKLLEETIQ